MKKILFIYYIIYPSLQTHVSLEAFHGRLNEMFPYDKN